MIIDDKGRLFGKINVIDAFVLLVLLVAATVLGFRVLGESDLLTQDKVDYVFQFYAEDVADFVIDNIQIGGTIEDEGRNITLGTITDVQVDRSIIYTTDSNGDMHKASRVDYSSLIITADVSAIPFENGVLVNNNKYTVGHSLTIRADKGKVFIRVYSIEEKGA